MALLAQLEPRRDPNEALVDGLSERPTISLRSKDLSSSSSSSSLTLGRGSLTGISDRTIGEAIVNISFDESSIEQQRVKATLMRDSERSRVHINGVLWQRSASQDIQYLHSGDLLSLDNLRYEYRIHVSMGSLSQISTNDDDPIFNDDDDPIFPPMTQQDAISIPSTPEPSPLSTMENANAESITLATDTATRLADEIQCPVCLEILVHPRSLNPCGHSFCAPCVQELDKCPQCRERIHSHVPARQLDSLVSTLICIPKLLSLDDVQHYNERIKKNPKVHSATAANKRASKRPRRERTSQNDGMPFPFPSSNPAPDPFFPHNYFPLVARAPSASRTGGNYTMPPGLSHPNSNNSSYRLGGGNSHQPPPQQQRRNRTVGASVADAICID